MASRRPDTSENTISLWRDYRRTGDQALRNRLVLTYAPLVKHIAYRKLREVPQEVDVEDLISCGLEALVGAIDRYDPDRGATLEQFAWTRIHGAVLDELRRLDWAPRSVRRWQRDHDRIIEEFTAIHGRPPQPQEVADALGITLHGLRRHLDDVARAGVTSLNVTVLADDELPVERVDTLVDDDVASDPVHMVISRAARARLRDALAELSERQRHIAVLLYVERLTLAEAGTVLGVSESRMCQLHAALKRRLRGALSDDELLFGGT